MSSFIVTDCLVLKLVEVESGLVGRIDTTMYIIYDKETHMFIIRGKRRDLETYSFECEYADDVATFIQYAICSRNRLNETLYNFKDLHQDANDITFEYLDDALTEPFEISGYDDKKLGRNRLLKNLRMLRSVSNYYN
jgi:hypothetical protein